MPRQIYSVGTVSVTEGSTTLTGIGTAWDIALVQGGLLFIEGSNSSVPIAEITSDTTGTLAFPWPGLTMAGASYWIYLETAQAASTIEANARLAEIARRVQSGTFLQPDAVGTLSERAEHDDEDQGFIFIRWDVEPFLVYFKTSNASGAWSNGQPLIGPAGPPGSDGIDGIGDRYSVTFEALGRPGTAETWRTIFADTVTFPAAFAGSVAVATSAADAEAVFTIAKNGAAVGTITFEAGSATGVFAGAGAAFTGGDILSLIAPDPRDATLSALLFNLAGNR